jgi:DNA-binding MarR family transcriptional regulator
MVHTYKSNQNASNTMSEESNNSKSTENLTNSIPEQFVHFLGLEPDAAHAWRHENLARLMLFPFHAMESSVLDAIHFAGYRDLRPTLLSVLRNLAFEGSRIVDLAARANVTKAAMGQLVAQCVKLGYVSIEPDPKDGRASIAKATIKGRHIYEIARATMAKCEVQLKTMIGEHAYVELREDLQFLRDQLNPVTQPSVE